MAWYEHSFGKDYLIVYKHRDMEGAYNEVHRMVRWLHLRPGDKVLDLCCGMGRHSLALADMGFSVTGLDLSGDLLAEARKIDTSHRVDWVQGDMRHIPLEGGFAAVVNLFTSFGYFDTDEENSAVLREMDRMLLPGGRFIIDFINSSYVADHLVPYSERDESTLTIEETRTIEQGYVKKQIVIKEKNQPDRSYREQVRLYGLDQFTAMFQKTQLKTDKVYGHYDEDAYDAGNSKRLIIVGSKRTASV